MIYIIISQCFRRVLDDAYIKLCFSSSDFSLTCRSGFLVGLFRWLCNVRFVTKSKRLPIWHPIFVILVSDLHGGLSSDYLWGISSCVPFGTKHPTKPIIWQSRTHLKGTIRLAIQSAVAHALHHAKVNLWRWCRSVGGTGLSRYLCAANLFLNLKYRIPFFKTRQRPL